MTDPFVFATDGRTFTCHIESSRATRGEAWWWFTVSGDGQRYAAFRPTEGESQEDVQARIAHYYADRLERIAAPPVKRWSRGGPPDKTGAVVEPTEPLPEEIEEAVLEIGELDTGEVAAPVD